MKDQTERSDDGPPCDEVSADATAESLSTSPQHWYKIRSSYVFHIGSIEIKSLRMVEGERAVTAAIHVLSRADLETAGMRVSSSGHDGVQVHGL